MARLGFSMSPTQWLLVVLACVLLVKEQAVALISVRTPFRTTPNSLRTSRPNPFDSSKLYAIISPDEDEILSNTTLTNVILSELDETKRLVEAQQRYIDMLVARSAPSSDGESQESIVEPSLSDSQSASEGGSSASTIPTLEPLKVMLFIDGTWLYYSLHEREDEWDTIVQQYGKGWQFKYNIDWSRLPRIICQALQEQEKVKEWSAIMPGSERSSDDNNTQPSSMRPIDVVRVSVFTSYKADTPKTSKRYKMFQDMLNAKYDVHMMETVGKGEKCVDIQLAVDMLHYATVPDAYDVALLLSGDKDFMPAMVRCRQKGRRVGLISMRRACNRALVETPNMKDYDVIWLEDHLESVIQPRPQSEIRGRNPNISEFALMKVVSDYIAKSGMPRVSSRDIGKYVKSLKVGDRNVLEEVKEKYGGLYQFLIVSEIFVVEKIDNVKAFWVALREKAGSKMAEEAKKTTFTAAEKRFFDHYDLHRLENREKEFFHTIQDSPGLTFPLVDHAAIPPVQKVELPEVLPVDYDSYTVAKLKEICRAEGLLVSGKKAELIERIVSKEAKASAESQSIAEEDLDPEAHLKGLLLEYLQVKGGQASSRDVGRYLQANKASAARLKGEPTRVSALTELKERFGTVRQFAIQSDMFSDEQMESEESYEFLIRLNTTQGFN